MHVILSDCYFEVLVCLKLSFRDIICGLSWQQANVKKRSWSLLHNYVIKRIFIYNLQSEAKAAVRDFSD